MSAPSGGNDGASAAAATPVPGAADLDPGIPPFGGDQVLSQLNAWAAVVDSRIAALVQGITEVRGGSVVAATQLQADITTLEAKVMANLQQVADSGVQALFKTIDDFKVELGKHEYAHQQARSGVEQVVAQATLKFADIERAMSENERRVQAADAQLRAQVQAAYTDLDTRLKGAAAASPSAPAPAAAPAAAAAAAATGSQAAGQALGGGSADPLFSPGGDAWARPSAPQPAPPGSGGLLGQPLLPPQQPPPTQRPFSVQNRDWGDNRRLDLVVTPEAYTTWRDRALGHLAKDRPDVRRLLLWAEQQPEAISAAAEATGAREAGLRDDVADVSYVLFEGIKHVVHDNLLSRARTCDGRGLELWRKLHSEWEGAAPQVVAAKAKSYQDPRRCGTVLQLWEDFPAWEQLGAEVVSGGFPSRTGSRPTRSRSSCRRTWSRR